MIESPVLQRFAANQRRKGYLQGMVRGVTMLLEVRFGSIPDDLGSLLRAIDDEATLERLARSAVRCPDLVAFRAGLPS